MPRPLELPLPRLQRWMQAVIEQPGTAEEAVTSPAARAELEPDEIARVIRPSKTLTPVERVGVYQGMYLLRMVEALENDFPAVAHLLGAEDFADLVTRYVAAHPSRSYTLNRLGDRLPEFIRGSQGIRRKAFVADLARLESLVTEVFDAPESPAWPAEEIARVPEAAWPGVVLSPSAALRVAAFAYPVNAYLQSVKDDDHDHPPTGRRPPGSPSIGRTTKSGASTSRSRPTTSSPPWSRAGRSARPSQRRRGGSRAPPATSSSGGCATGWRRVSSRASSFRPRADPAPL